MYKRIQILLWVIAILFISSGCQQQKAENEKKKEENCAPLNPNGDSELSLLMRKMAKLGEENALALREGRELVPYEGGFEAMLSASRSMHVEEEFFQGMAKNYLNNLEKLYAADAADRVALHNNMIQSCQSCHGETCRGPLKRIDKMLVSK